MRIWTVACGCYHGTLGWEWRPCHDTQGGLGPGRCVCLEAATDTDLRTCCGNGKHLLYMLRYPLSGPLCGDGRVCTARSDRTSRMFSRERSPASDV